MREVLEVRSKLHVLFRHSVQHGLDELSAETVERLEAVLVEALEEIDDDSCGRCGLPVRLHNSNRCPTLALELAAED